MTAGSEVSPADEGTSSHSTSPNRYRRRLLIALNALLTISGETGAILLNRFYHDQGGRNLFMTTLVQTSGFPILFIPFLLFPHSHSSPFPSPPPKKKQTFTTYITLGSLIALDNLLFSVGASHLSPASFSLISSSQLAFTTLFSYFLNAEKLTHLALNSVGMVAFSAALTAVNKPPSPPNTPLGFITTLAGSALYSLILSLTQLSFQKFLKKGTFYVVLELQIWVSVVATLFCIVGGFASGEWRGVGREMAAFGTGRNSYVMTLVWAAACWQLSAVGMVGLVFMVSALFSNVVGSVALAVAPVVSLVVFGDRASGVKIVALVQAIWGFGSYAYEHCSDAGDEGGGPEQGLITEPGSDGSGLEV